MHLSPAATEDAIRLSDGSLTRIAAEQSAQHDGNEIVAVCE
jgi:hypothetical protein